MIDRIFRVVWGPSRCYFRESQISEDDNLSFILEKTITFYEAWWKQILSFIGMRMIRGLYINDTKRSSMSNVAIISILIYLILKSIQSVRKLTSKGYLSALDELEKLKEIKYINLDHNRDHLEQLNSIHVDFEYLPVIYHQKFPAYHLVYQPVMQSGVIQLAASWIASKTLAPLMLFPGYMLNFLMTNILMKYREALISKGALRMKLRTINGLEVDTAFMDARTREKTSTKVIITSEGNCSFYEVREMAYLKSQGYSCIGWNMPGFGSSSGVPDARKIAESISTVVEYATEFCKFSRDDIILYGWSLGGFPTSISCANKNLRIKSAIFDATFDDLLPLAFASLPSFLHSVAFYTIKTRYNFDILRNLQSFEGFPIFVIRTRDEIINTGLIRGKNVSENRTAHLAVKFLSSKYSEYFDSQFPELFLEEIDTMMDDLTTPQDPGMVRVIITETINSIKHPHDVDELFSLRKTLMCSFMKQHCLIIPANHNDAIDLCKTISDAEELKNNL